MDRPSIDELAGRYVEPFYLDMMRLNAVKYGRARLPDIVITSRTVTASDLVRLLCHGWRERVMGAWFSVRIGGPEVTTAVLHALGTSQGSLDAPPLAAAAVVLAGPDALDPLERYFAVDQAQGWGSAGLIAAAADYLCRHHFVTASLPAATCADQKAFGTLVEFAQQLQT